MFQRPDYNQRPFERKMYQGDWACADCGTKITELPFEPSPDRPVRCLECHRKWKNSQGFSR